MKRKITSLTTAIIVLFLILLTLPETGWGQTRTTTYEQLTSISNIDGTAQYVLGIDGTGFHYSGTSSWGLTALPSSQTPLYYTLTKASDGNSFTAQTTIGNTTYYLQIPTSNTFSMATSTGANTDIIIGTTEVSGTNYAVANKTTTDRHLRINGTSGLRSYDGTTGTMAFFYKVVEAVPYTVTLADDNSTLPEASAGAGVTLPSRSNVSPYTFAGWSATTCGSQETTTAPASIIPAGTYYPTANITLYPVYKRVDSSSSTTAWYETALANADEGVYALLTPDGKAFNGSISSGNGGATTNAFSFNNGVASQAPSGVCEITFTAVKNNNNVVLGYTMYNSGSNKGYLYASKAASGGLAWHDSEDYYWHQVTYSNVANWEYSKSYSGSYARLRTYNSTFRTYNANTNGDLKLAKKVTTYTTYYISVVSTGVPSITAANVEILYNATGGSIGYSITDEPETPGTLTAAIKAGTTSTITNLTIDNNNITNTEVPFTCNANNEFSAHTATVTLTYTYGNNETVTKDVTITQAAHPTPSITANDVNINYNSTGGNIAYTINDGIEGGSVSASVPNNSWITLPNTFASPIEFTCETTEGVVARTETVTLTYTYNSNQTVTKEVTVTQGVDATLGTSANPYTVAQARTFIDGLNGQTSADGKHVSGIISQVDSYSSQYNSITYWISDDGTTTSEQLYVYSGKGISGADFTSLEDLQKADRVVVKGNLKFYDNKYEFNYNNELVSLDRDATITVANTNIEVNAIAGQSTINVTYNNFGTETILADVTYYEADGETVVTNPGTVYPWFVAEINNANNVECTYVEHTGNTARTAYFKVWAYYDDNMNENEIVYSDLVTFTQRTPAQTQYPITKTATLAGTILVKDVNNNELTEALPNTEVYLTFEAADCQTFNTWTVSNTSTNPATSVTVTDGHFTMPAGAVTVTANTTASPVLEYLYVVNGVNGEDQSTCTSPLTLPTTVETPRGFRFVGWTTDEDDVDNIITSYSFDANETVSFYAVFAHLEGGVYTYQRITSNNDLSDGNYLIVYENVNGSKIQDAGYYDIDAAPNNLDVTINEGNIIDGASAINNATFTIAAYGETANTYSVLSTSGKYMGQTTNANGMTQNTTWNANLANTITFDGNNCNIVGVGGAYFRYNSASNQQRFRYYKSNSYTNQQAIQLYKQTVVEAGSTVRYTRVLNTNPTETVTITVPTIINSGTILNMNGQTLTCDDPANLIIEDGAQLITTSTGVEATVKKNTLASTDATKDEAVNNWYAIASPISNGVIADFVQGTHNVYRYVEKSFYWNEYRSTVTDEELGLASFANFENGRGYLYRSTEPNIAFAGAINAEDVPYKLTADCTNADFIGFNLIGNPFTHDIYKNDVYQSSGDNLPAINSDKLAVGYYRLGTDGTWTSTIGYNNPIKPGEAVMVKASEGFTLTIENNNNPAAEYTPSSKSGLDNVIFTVANNQYQDVAYAMFNQGVGLNKIEHYNADAQMLYISQDDDKYSIAMMSDDTRVINLNFKAMTMGKYTLALKAYGNFSYMHLIDKLTGEDVDMLLEGEYSFMATPADNDSRFIVRLDYQPGGAEGNKIFAYQNGAEIFVTGEGELQVFDVMGRFVNSYNVNGNKTISVSELNTGVYVFRLVGNEIHTQKIVVK